MRVLIVDDEPIIRQGISTVIEWEKEGFELLPPAESAEEALDRLAAERPDILFTDIRMNGKSGLELAKEAKAAYPEMEIVVLSGYDEFQYAQQALRDGVSDYLLKSSRPEEILNTAARMRQVIRDKQSRKGELRLLEKAVLTKQTLTADERARLLERYPQLATPPDGSGLRILVVSTAGIAGDSARAAARAALEREAGGKAIEAAEQWIVPVRVPPGGLGRLNRAPAAASEAAGVRLAAAAGAAVRELDALHASFRQATSALAYGWILGEERLIVYERIHNRRGIRTVCTAEEEAEMIAVLKTGSPGTARDWAWTLLEGLRADPQLTPASLQMFLQSLLIAGYRWLERVAASLGASVRETESGAGDEAGDRTPPAAAFAERAAAIAGLYAGIAPAKPAYVRQAIELIRERLGGPVSLVDISREIHIHPNYLSERFKQETGLNFSEFVVRERMNRAMAILRETPAKIDEVGHLVGYSDGKHFKRLFKKHTGTTPSEYRANS